MLISIDKKILTILHLKYICFALIVDSLSSLTISVYVQMPQVIFSKIYSNFF